MLKPSPNVYAIIWNTKTTIKANIEINNNTFVLKFLNNPFLIRQPVIIYMANMP